MIYVSLAKGAVDSVIFLISRGADINCRTNDNETALHYAVRARDPVMVKLLLQRVRSNYMHKKLTPLRELTPIM